MLVLLSLVIVLSGCAGNGSSDQDVIATLVSGTQTAAPQVTLPQPEPTNTMQPDTSDIPLDGIYQDPELGYGFNYPDNWKIAYQETQSRGGYLQFARNDFEVDPNAGGLPAEEILLQVAVYNWDPKGNLEAYLEQRLFAWENSGIAVSEEKRWEWGDGVPAVLFQIEGIEGDVAFVILTVVEDRYLEISTSTEYDVLSALGSTLREVE
jgi:hypothetical protein